MSDFLSKDLLRGTLTASLISAHNCTLHCPKLTEKGASLTFGLPLDWSYIFMPQLLYILSPLIIQIPCSTFAKAFKVFSIELYQLCG
jgi:hypothetical protein